MTETKKAVQAMQDYIEQHLQEEITLADLSQVAMFSPWYSHRLFTVEIGVSPAEYIRKLRLTEASKHLKRKDSTVTKLAFTYCFGSVDGFSRAFNREFGITPGAYRLKPIPITLFVTYGVKFKEIMEEERSKVNTVRNVFIQVIRKQQRKAIIKRGVKGNDYWSYSNEVGCDVWGMLLSMDSLCGEPVCLWLPENFRKPHTSEYVQGVEVEIDYSGPIPEGFDVITLPEADYLMFQGEPFREEGYVNAIAEVQHSMKQYDPAIIGYAWDEANPRIQMEPRGERGYIELKAVKSK